MFAHFGLRLSRRLLRPHLSFLHSPFTVVRSLSWGFGLVWRSSTIAGTITAPILLLALRSAADLAGFSPVSRFFALVWGLLLFLRNFLFYSLATLMVYLFFFAPSVYSPLPAELCLLPLLLLGWGGLLLSLSPGAPAVFR